MRASPLIAAALLLTAIFLAGCGTMPTPGGGGQLEDTVNVTYRLVRKIDSDLSGVNRLNQTAADLNARLEANSHEIRLLEGLVKENQAKLDELLADLDRLTIAVYREFGLSMPPPQPGLPQPPPPGDLEEITIVPPPGRPEPSPLEMAPPARAPVTPLPSQPMVPPAAPPPAAPAPAQPAPAAAGTTPLADYQLAQNSFINQDYAEALRLYDAYLLRYPNTEYCHLAQFWKAKCYYKLERYPEAIREFEKLRTLYPSSSYVSHALHDQAAAHLKLGQSDQARALLRELLDKYPLSPAADESAKAKLRELEGN